MAKKISVIIPFYSNVKWLLEAIDSVLSQSYQDFEIIIVNDGSPEVDTDVINKSRNNNKIKYFKKSNGGPSSARNYGLKNATGKYVAFLDSDDIWHPNKLQKQVEFMEANSAIWSQHSYFTFDSTKEKTHIVNTVDLQGDVTSLLFSSFNAQTSCFMVLREVLMENNILFPIDMRYGEDNWFYYQLSKRFPLYSIDEVLSGYRLRGTNAGNDIIVQFESRIIFYNKIKAETCISNFLRVIYKVCKLNYNLYLILSKLFLKKQKSKQLLAKYLYLLPWIGFKIEKIRIIRSKRESLK